MAAGIYRQAVPRIGLSIERGTDAVPDDGEYHVLLEGQHVFASQSEKEALAEYRRLTSEGKLGEAGAKLDDLKRTLEEMNRAGPPAK